MLIEGIGTGNYLFIAYLSIHLSVRPSTIPPPIHATPSLVCHRRGGPSRAGVLCGGRGGSRCARGDRPCDRRRTEEAAEAADESVQVVLLDPIFTVTAISKVRVHACNGLGCSEASTESSWTSLSINAESEVQSVVERYESNNISFTLASSVAPGDGDPQTTMLYWEAAGNVSQSIAASLLVGKTLSGNVSFGFQTSRAVSLLDLEFIGEVEYKFACQYCSKGVGGVRFCGSLFCNETVFS